MSVITISRIDDHVTIDGETRTVDASSLPAYVSVIQWSDDASAGWIEFVNDGHGAFLPNCKIVDFAPYQYMLEAYHAA